MIHDLQPQQQGIIASGYSETNGLKETPRLETKAYIKKRYLLSTAAVLRRVLE